MLFPPNPISGEIYYDEVGNKYVYNSNTEVWDTYNAETNTVTPGPTNVFAPGYRLQDKDLNVNFCTQSISYPPGLAYFYTPYSLIYEIYFINSDGRVVPYGNENRIPEKVDTGIYRANFVVGDNWPTGHYNIIWKYRIYAISNIQTITDTFQVTDGGYENNIFVYLYCNNDFTAALNVLQESFDVPASFTII
jgi:hypothetical protein